MLEVLNVLSGLFTNSSPSPTSLSPRWSPDQLASWPSLDSKANVTKGNFYKDFPRKTYNVNTWNATDNSKNAGKRRVINHAFCGENDPFCGDIHDPTCQSWVQASSRESREGMDKASGYGSLGELSRSRYLRRSLLRKVDGDESTRRIEVKVVPYFFVSSAEIF